MSLPAALLSPPAPRTARATPRKPVAARREGVPADDGTAVKTTLSHSRPAGVPVPAGRGAGRQAHVGPLGPRLRPAAPGVGRACDIGAARTVTTVFIRFVPSGTAMRKQAREEEGAGITRTAGGRGAGRPRGTHPAGTAHGASGRGSPRRRRGSRPPWPGHDPRPQAHPAGGHGRRFRACLDKRPAPAGRTAFVRRRFHDGENASRTGISHLRSCWLGSGPACGSAPTSARRTHPSAREPSPPREHGGQL